MNIKKMNFKNRNKGQVMILTTFAMGASVIIFSAVVGHFVIQRIRASSNISDSARAIFAADSGLECELYNKFKTPEPLINCCSVGVNAVNVFDDNRTTVKTENDLGPSCGAGSNPSSIFIRSVGTSNGFNRAYEASF